MTTTTTKPPRFDHSQSASTIHVSIYQKNCKAEHVRATLVNADSLKVELADAVVVPVALPCPATFPSTPMVECGAFTISIAVEKDVKLQQERLLMRSQDTAAAAKKPWTVPPGRQAADWDSVEREGKEDEKTEAGLLGMFRNIYDDGDEDTKHAMMKSYSTSGGTVLSTNWKEVRDADYVAEAAKKS